jgi:2',3'-cyclic-nucleotide 2'-phosphodiesterase (5'-nucleotidase family)
MTLRRAASLLIVAAILLGGCGMLRRGAAAPDLVRVTVLQINDAYTLDPVDNGRRGGMARLATLVKELRAKNPHTLFVHGGDFLSPSVLSTYLKGRHMVAVLDAIGVDAVTFGNHEFDFGPAVLAERMRESRFAWISSNVRDRKTDGTFASAQHDRLVTLAGIRVGLLGLTLPETAKLASAGPDVVFADPLRAGVEAATGLRRRGAQVVIALTHQDMDADRALAEKAPIDLIAGGHEHEPLIAEAGNAIVTKAGSDARYLVQVDLWLTRDGKVVERSWTFHEVSARIAPDPAVEKLVARYTAEFERELSVAVGRTEVALDARRQVLRTQEVAVGNFIADVMREALDADVGLMNGGGIRGDRIIPPGPLLRRDIHTLVPFSNGVVKLEMTGTALSQALEHGLAQADNQGGGFLQISGAQIVYDPRRPAGRRIVSARIGGRPLDPEARYTVATIDYVANGGDGQTAFRGARTLLSAASAPGLPTLVLRAIETRKSIAQRVENRLRVATQSSQSAPAGDHSRPAWARRAISRSIPPKITACTGSSTYQ